MQEDTNASASSMAQTGSTLMFIGFFSMFFFPPLGFSCCGLGILMMVLGGVQAASNNPAAEGAMQLIQDSSGQWVYKSQEKTSSFAFNSHNNQILSRLIKQVREGRPLNEIPENELEILASAYGIHSGTAEQKIEALRNSEMATNALLLSGSGAVAGAAAAVAATESATSDNNLQNTLKDLAKNKKEELEKEHGIVKSIDTEKALSGELDISNDIVLQQLSSEIRKRNLTPKSLIELADLNNDGQLNATEISGALTAMLGMSVPVFIVSGAMDRFDLDSNGELDIDELSVLWTKLGIDFEENDGMESDEDLPTFPVGSRIEANWNSSGKSFRGTVIEVNGNLHNIQYDDGDLENGVTLDRMRPASTDNHYPKTLGKWEGSIPPIVTPDNQDSDDDLTEFERELDEIELPSIDINLRNEFDFPIEIYWISEDGESLLLGAETNAMVAIETYPGTIILAKMKGDSTELERFVVENDITFYSFGENYQVEEDESSEDLVVEEETHEDEIVEEGIDHQDDSIEEEEEETVDYFEDGDSIEDSLTSGIDTEFEELIVKLGDAILSSDRKKILKEQTHEYEFSMKITKFERTLLGSPEYRGGQSIHGIIDGGPFEGVARIPKAMDESVQDLKIGSDIRLKGIISDYMPSLQRCVIDSNGLL